MLIRPPSVSRPHEPALSAHASGRERHRVAGAALAAVMLDAGDTLQVIDVEGRQRAELLALRVRDGGSALAALDLTPDVDARFIPECLNGGSAAQRDIATLFERHGLTGMPLPAGAILWSGDTHAGRARTFVATEPLVAIVAAPGGPVPVDRVGRSATELHVSVVRARKSATAETSMPLADPLADFVIRPGTAVAYTVAAGEYIQIVDADGRQCSDFVAFDLDALGRHQEVGLDPTVTRTLNGHAYPLPGLYSRFFDQLMQPMLEVVHDTVGRHDTFALACTARYYETQGYPGHANCSDNISAALAEYGIAARPGWPAINFFFNTAIDAHGQMTIDEPWSRPGDYVLMRALKPLLCVSTSCPDDIDPANAWQPTDIRIRTYSSEAHFTMSTALRSTPDALPVLTRQSGFHARTSALTRHFVDYRGWHLPARFDGYGAIDEYYGCRERAAIIDLSALRKFDVVGPDAEALLQYCLTRDVRRLAVGQVVYSAMCHPHGGMLDDGTLMRLGPDTFRWICGDDFAGIWLREQANTLGMKAWIKSSSDQIHNVAVQGPRSREILRALIRPHATQPSLDSLGWFRFLIGRVGGDNGCPVIVSRTGYTGELGYEVWCHPRDAQAVWDAIWAAGQPHGLVPLGLDALDLLRIEAGLVFAGYEFTDETDPFEAGIGFSVPLKTKTDDFVGRDALLRRSAHPQRRLVGLELAGNEPAHHGDCVHNGRAQVGVVTSGMRSPILGTNIALARIDVHHAQSGDVLHVGKLDGQQKRIDARVTAPIFYDPEKTRVRS
ncbi:aminomethyltransferase [Burkholderia multivorans]